MKKLLLGSIKKALPPIRFGSKASEKLALSEPAAQELPWVEMDELETQSRGKGPCFFFFQKCLVIRPGLLFAP